MDRLTLCIALLLKILLFSGSNLLYLRHVRVAYGWAADLAAVSLLLILGTVVSEFVAIGDVTFVGLAVGVWGILIVLRGMVLPMKLTAEGVERFTRSLVLALGGGWGDETQSLVNEGSSPEERWPLSSSDPQ